MTKTSEISAKDVAALRARTGAGMMDCKHALEETKGDIEKAIELLRKKGIAKGEKRAGRGAKEGVIASYVHFNGKVGVLVEVNCETDFVARTEDFQALAKDLALHIASADPVAVAVEDVPADVVAREREIYRAQAAESGKPANIVEKMVEGSVQKFLKEVTLLSQPFVKDDKQSVGKIADAAKMKVVRFERWELGK